jgi:hypothetical protein
VSASGWRSSRGPQADEGAFVCDEVSSQLELFADPGLLRAGLVNLLENGLEHGRAPVALRARSRTRSCSRTTARGSTSLRAA